MGRLVPYFRVENTLTFWFPFPFPENVVQICAVDFKYPTPVPKKNSTFFKQAHCQALGLLQFLKIKTRLAQIAPKPVFLVFLKTKQAIHEFNTNEKNLILFLLPNSGCSRFLPKSNP
jgi:hypothetical protein